MPLIFEQVSSLDQAIKMLEIRNQCYEFMTGNPNKIDLADQLIWFTSKYLPALEVGRMGAFLCYNPTLVGYGIIRLDEPYEGYSLLTGGLVEDARGMGHGKELFQFLIDHSREFSPSSKIGLEVKKINERAYRLYLSLGFQQIWEKNDIFFMELKNES